MTVESDDGLDDIDVDRQVDHPGVWDVQRPRRLEERPAPLQVDDVVVAVLDEHVEQDVGQVGLVQVELGAHEDPELVEVHRCAPLSVVPPPPA